MAYQILLNFGASDEAKEAYDVIRQYAMELGVSQNKLFMIALIEMFANNGRSDIAHKIETYSKYDGRRKP